MSRWVVLAFLLSASAPPSTVAAERAAFATTATECFTLRSPPRMSNSEVSLLRDAPKYYGQSSSKTLRRMASTLSTTTGPSQDTAPNVAKGGKQSSFAASLSSSFSVVADPQRIPRKKIIRKTTSRQTIAHSPSHSPATPTKTGIQTITSMSSFLDFLDTEKSSREDESFPPLCVVKFHAPYCKVCQRINLKYKQLAGSYTRDFGDSVIRFADVDVVENKEMSKLLQVTKTPFVQIYRNRECIASFGTGPAFNFPIVVGNTLSHFLGFSSPRDWKQYRTEFQSNINEALDALKQIEALAQVEKETTEDDRASSSKDLKVEDTSRRRAANGTILSP